MNKSERDVDLLVGCFNSNGMARNRSAAVWQYLGNPTGALFVDFALHGDQVAAVYATLPVRLRINGVVRLGLQSLDTITDTNFRGAGLFKHLAASVFGRAAKEDCALIYGFPNQNSAHGFFERLGWARLDPVPFLIRPLKSRYVLKRLGLERLTEFLPDLNLLAPNTTRLHVEIIARFDESFTRMWEAYAQQTGVTVERDAAYLNWRICDKPGEQYTTLAVRDGANPVAFVTYTVKDKHGARVGYLMEALCEPSHRRTLRRLVKRALHAMASEGADVSLAWCLPHSLNFSALLYAGYLPFPARFRPIELHFGARAFDDSVARDVQNRRSWYLSYLDSDTV